MVFRRQLFILTLIFLSGCFRVGEELKPQLNISVQDRYLKSLPSPFSHASENTQEEWAREERIGMGFAQELDLYQALTAFKRASFLLPPSNLEKKLELHYDILLAYYLGGKYVETIYTYESTALQTVSSRFTPYHDLLVMLYDAHFRLDHDKQANAILKYLATEYPDTAQKLILFSHLLKGDIPSLRKEGASHPEIQKMLDQYELEKKSTTASQALNAIIPGPGYLYIGQIQSALTAFFLNALFIWAAVYFFRRRNIALGIILISLEAGWYFGGIYGAGQEAKLYNERVYERLATPVMNENRYFPLLLLKYGF